jgi:hypothetical protein
MRYLGLMIALALPGMASAQDAARAPVAAAASGSAQAESGQPPQRIRSVTLQPGERCPAATGDEVVVCYNGGNPYRIPPTLRESTATAASQSWVNRAASVDQVSRVSGGLPDTCSPVGTGGQSGCALAQNRAYAADKRAREAEERVTPGGDED